ncbi:MAG: hypothetical protein ACYTG3_14315 [Planctomycetota bacterium]|jgi:hypothetical protein
MLRDEGLERLLRRLNRHPPPEVPLEAIFERWERRRRKGWAISGLAAAAALLVGVILLSDAGEPPVPVQLQLQMVDVPADDLADTRDDIAPQEVGP